MNRGKPLPIDLRCQIRYHASQRMTETRIAQAVGVSRTTVRKYLGKFVQGSLKRGNTCSN